MRVIYETFHIFELIKFILSTIFLLFSRERDQNIIQKLKVIRKLHITKEEHEWRK